MGTALINLSNLHAGGTLQVGISVVREILDFPASKEIDILVSTEIFLAIRDLLPSPRGWNVQVHDKHGFSGFLQPPARDYPRHKVVFTLFGPNYSLRAAPIEIVGFAQLWILQPHNPAAARMGLLRRLRTRMKYLLQESFFRRATHLVVELEHVRDALRSKVGFQNKPISVVHNAVSRLYLDQSSWIEKPLVVYPGEIRLGLVSRAYPHKNLSILPAVAELLRTRFGLPIRIYLTLTPTEWASFEPRSGPYIHNVGELSVYECPSFYNQMDGVIFPSLLECFSATPLEAMVMRKPLFASDRPFVRDCCDDFPQYFDPLSANSIAKTIAEYYHCPPTDAGDRLSRARSHVLSFSDARVRAQSYLNLVRDYL